MDDETIKRLNAEQQRIWDGFLRYLADLVTKELSEEPENCSRTNQVN